MSNINQNIPLLISGLIIFILSSVQASEIITLKMALKIACEKNPLLSVSRSDLQSASARVIQAKAAYYPQLNASIKTNRNWREMNNNSSMNNNNEITDNYAIELSVSQHLFDFGKTSAQVESSQQALRAFEKSYEIVEKTLVRDVKQAFFEVLKQKQLVIVAKESLEFRNQQLKQACALYQKGLRPKIDLTRGEVDVSQAKLNLVIVEYGQKDAIIAFEKLLGASPASERYSLLEASNSSAITTTLSLDDLIQTAIENNPEIDSLKAQSKAAEAALFSARRNAYPGLNANCTYIYDGDSLPLDDQHWKVGIYLNWPLFTGFRQTGQVNETKSNLNKLNAMLEHLKLSIKQAVSKAYFKLKTNQETITNAEISLTQASENLAIAQGRYRAGISDAIELNAAQVLYTESRSTLIRATFERHKALAELEFAVGVNYFECKPNCR
ncbi:MAG: type I secretion outer membrane protein [Candidatus Magnetoglobus multicellularis str. Araruama]|uniref:Type I secretion outer membrane protein n=1 Tax=Candidatus Magnetoglobus multicellularis str. Araruama TaxID=890399 RepID=A0A1V1PCN9_9BACT|nr:MAG: type I secretion outer membrane protein [Candidatus Magnetoglobus multicellularis str. Araruama]